MPAERVTLATIAEAAGVSVPTVSRVLNGDGNVAKATRLRIEALLDEHGYRPRTVRASSAGMVHVIYPRIDTAWQLEHIRGMEAVMQEAGVGLVVSALNHGTAGRNDLLRRAQAGQATGAILAAASGDTPLAPVLDQLNVPVITLDPGAKAPARLPSIGAANWQGARAATEHLLALGHRRVAMITGSKGGLLCSRARLDGYRAALEDAGVPEDPSLIRHGEFEFEAGITAAKQLIDHPNPPTAIFACSDLIALGVYEAARQRGVSIPADLSVVGFDDLPAARWASPALTTVRQPLEEMGRLAARTVLTMAGRRSLPSPRMELSTRLIVRSSTAPPPRPRRG
ncbi:LacI family DNA-binding transcriptional regulator [Paractinoplanes durhamensis]|uniref:LacI family transcriptional regulator n=1 Tax=Paractinoplanes durhamensis TaxID=113563 RepID=A0ABQ3YWP6_9ACTN|nr:LacI family DNA-binding transcriptional regulator [Actinoplanes durhamensis]GIE02015.1 LacI family transcriptional regulator [Actinoplanes durhamensis]